MPREDEGGTEPVVKVDLTIEASADRSLQVRWTDINGGAPGEILYTADDERLVSALASAFFSRQPIERCGANDEGLNDEEVKRIQRQGPEKVLGFFLGNLLLPLGKVRDRFNELRTDRRLVLALGVDGDPEMARKLAALPWELTLLVEHYAFDSANAEIIRLPSHVCSDQADLAVEPSDTARVLVFEGARVHPSGRHLERGKASRILREALPGDVVDIHTFVGTVDHLRLELDKRQEIYDLVVFEGHGSRGRLWTYDEEASTDGAWADGSGLALALKGHVRAALLVACNAGQAADRPGSQPGVAELLTQEGIPTLAFQTTIYDHDEPGIDETRSVLLAVGAVLGTGGTMRDATAAVRRSLTGIPRGNDDGQFARPVLWQPTPEDVWIRKPTPIRAELGWFLTHRSARPERPWGKGAWLQRPGNTWDAVLSSDGAAWLWTRDGVAEVETVDRMWGRKVEQLDVGAIPIAMSPIFPGSRVRVLTTGDRTTDWWVHLYSDAPQGTLDPRGRALHAAWVSNRFVWTDAERNVHAAGDLPLSDAAHVASAEGPNVTTVAWIDSQRTLRAWRSDAGTELRSLALLDHVVEIDELAVAPTYEVPDQFWIRVGDAWWGCSWDSIGPADP